MSEEAQAAVTESAPAVAESTESQSSATEPSTESTESAPAQTTEARPAGYAPIDPKAASPEQVQQRLDYLYGQLKPTQRENREMRQLLAEQSRVITELSEGQRAVVNHLTERSFNDNEDQLKSAMQEAWQRQDNRAYIEAQNKLMDLQVEKKILERQKPQQQPPNQQPQYRNAAEIANGAVQSGEISTEEYRATEAWQGEKDDGGRLLRPWAYSNDPDYQAALFETRSVMANPRLQHLTYEQKLAEVDKRMGVQKRSSGQQVMGGNLTQSKKSTKIELTSKQREIALRTKYAGKDKSEADHLEAYRKQVEKFTKNPRRV